MPKMIVNGTNDPYWTQDALNFYWNDLKGPKNVCYVPNAGHDLRTMKDPAADKPEKDIFPMKAVNAIAAFSHAVISGVEMPQLNEKIGMARKNEGSIAVMYDVKPKVTRVWSANSDTRDFRKQRWAASDESVFKGGDGRVVEMAAKNPFLAFFFEAEYEIDGLKFCQSTPICIVEKK
jgi:PhoPQ-activated pathogenicity-related protein